MKHHTTVKKWLSLVLALLTVALCAVSCAKTDPDVPDGMMSATLPGEPFRLYVPESWSLNTASGISGAIYNSASKILVSARYTTPTDPTMTLDGYVDLCSSQYGATLTGYTVLDRKAAILGGENAVRLDYKITDGGEELTCFQVTALYMGDFVSVHGYCASSLYEARSEDFSSILSAFVLCEKTAPTGAAVRDKDTPEGYQIASADQLEYRLYAPLSWVCDPESGVSRAYCPEDGRPNVSVTSYSPDVSIGIQDYFTTCEQTYQAKLPGYERLSEQERTLAGRTAYSYTYRIVADGVSYTVMQTICVYNDMLYSFTYTALSEQFDAHLSEVEAMMNVFTFR